MVQSRRPAGRGRPIRPAGPPPTREGTHPLDDARMKAPSAGGRPATGLPEAALLLACGLMLALNVPVFASRLASVSRHYPLCITEGAEGPTIYPVWKVQAGQPLYEATFEAPYAITW